MTKDEFENRLLRHLTSMLESQQSLNKRLAEVIDRNGAYDAEFIKLNRHMHALTEGQIDIRADITTSRSEMSGLRNDLGSFRAEVNQRFADVSQRFAEIAQRLAAMNSRLEEIENTSDKNTSLIKELRIEIAGQYNEILNAVQSGVINGADLRDLTERVERIDRRLAP